jgi:hypothetical protein
MIKKIIHYCWFGGKAIPQDFSENIKGWKKLHPDWDVKEWNENCFPITDDYLLTATKNRNWANISNYVRLKVLNDYGGIYLDVDVKLIKPLTEIIHFECFLGFESGDKESEHFSINNAVMGSIPHHPFVRKCLEAFAIFDGNENANLSSPVLVTNVLKENFGLKEYKDQLICNIKLFEKEVFYPLPPEKIYDKGNLELYLHPQTIGVHIWGRSWYSKEELLERIDNQSNFINERIRYIDKLENIINSNIGKISLEELKQEGDLLVPSIVKYELEELKKSITDKANAQALILSAINKNFIAMESRLNTEVEEKASKSLYDYLYKRLSFVEEKVVDLTVDARFNQKKAEQDQNVISDLMRSNNSLLEENLKLGNIIKGTESKNESLVVALEERLVLETKSIKDELNKIKDRLYLKVEDDASGGFGTEIKKNHQLPCPESGTLDSDFCPAPVETNSKVSHYIYKNGDDALLQEIKLLKAENNDLVVKNQLLEDELQMRTQDLDRANFKINTFNSYLTSFSVVRKEYEDRIKLLENLIQKMRIKNRIKRLANLYREKS